MPEDVPAQLKELWEELPVGPLPAEHIRTSGRQRRRIRRIRGTISVAAAVAAVVVGTVGMVNGALPGAVSSPRAPVAGDPTAQGTGLRLRAVGFRGLRINVPRGWTTEQSPCSAVSRPHVFFASTAVWSCPAIGSSAPQAPTASLQIGPLDLFPLPRHTLQDQTHVGRLTIEHTPTTCHNATCSRAYAVRSANAFFLVRVPAHDRQLLTAIGKTIVPLPQGATAVPYTDSGANIGAVLRAMHRAHLKVHISTGSHATHQLVVSVTPGPGRIVPRRSTVTLHVQAYTSSPSPTPPASTAPAGPSHTPASELPQPTQPR